jgi:hypothetical protein
MKKLAYLLALGSGLAFAAGSTVDPTIPSASSPLESAPVRGNFAAAANDINALIQINAGTTAPATPLLGQQWLNTTSTPYVWNVFDGAVWDTIGSLNASTNTFQAGSVPWSGVTGTPTTLSGYGITNGVSSVGVTMPSAFSCTGSPVTSSGTVACAFAAQSQAYFLASPAGSTGAPLMRQIVATDVPTLNQSTTGNAATVTTNANLTGDVTSVGNATTLTPTGVTAGTYAQMTVDANGRATAGVTINTVPFGGTGVASISGIVKGAGTGPFVTATPGTDYIAPGGAFGTPSSLTCTNCSGTAAGLSIGGTVNGNTLTAGSSTYTGTAGKTYTFPATTDTVAGIGTAQTWTAAQTFTNSDLKLLGSSTGVTTFTSANSGASNYTVTVPAGSITVARTDAAQTFTGEQTFNGPSGSPAMLVQGAGTAGSNYGLRVQAGLNASDYSFYVVDNTSTYGLFEVLGTGAVKVNSGAQSPTTALIVTGATTISTTLGVSGVASFSGALTAGSSANTSIGYSGFANPTAGTSAGTSIALNGYQASANNYGIGISAAALNASGKYDIWYQTGSTNGGGHAFFSGTTQTGYLSLSGALSVLASVSSASNITIAGGRAVNTTSSASTATVAAGIASTYIATPGTTITVTLAAPTADGERRRIVFGAATTVTWAVTSPATAVAGLPTVYAANTHVEVVYNAVAGTPTNSAATTWYQY